MPPEELDNRMNAFYDGKFDVLLATTIVESGLDIPSANTIVVHRAEMFGHNYIKSGVVSVDPSFEPMLI